MAEPVSDYLSESGALSVSFQDEGDQPIFEPKPGETPIWNDTRVLALFEEQFELAEVEAGLSERFGIQEWSYEEIEDCAWERVWLDHFKPMKFGERLWIIPTGYDKPKDAICIALDPGLAFGTGTHPTTALCLSWLDSADLTGKVVIDYGCGSGVLAVAALMLGAEKVYAVDIDHQALTATLDNASKNQVEDKVICCLPGDLPDIKADILLANILANPLIALKQHFAELLRPEGLLVLSGILREQSDEVLQAYRDVFVMDEPVFQEDWVRLTGRS